MEKNANVKNQHIVNTKFGFIDLTNLVHRDNGNINWNDSGNAIIPFLYKGIKGELVYVGKVKNYYVKILYNNIYSIMHKTTLLKGQLGAVVNPNYHLPKYKVNDKIKTKNSILIINDIFLKDGVRYYKYQCLSCNYIGEISESCLLKGIGCPCCAGNKIVAGINDFNTKYPDLAKYLVDKKEGEVASSSKKIISWYCPNCGSVIKDKIINVVRRGIVCEKCGDRFSFNENVMANILNQLNIEYIIHKNFDWAKNSNGNNVYYDFYIPSLNCIIETHGMQHYENTNNKNFLPAKEQQKNDSYKQKIAIKNGIINYIVIDCRYSKIDWIKQSINSNELFNTLFNVNKIDWNTITYWISKKCENYDSICKMWNNGNSVSRISKMLKLDRHFISMILKYSVKNKDTDYSHEEATKRKMIGCQSTKYLRPIKCIDTGHVFRSISLCKKISQKILHVQINDKTIGRQIKKHSTHKGLRFEYITCEQFNMVKKESPELAFGDSFLLETCDDSKK